LLRTAVDYVKGIWSQSFKNIAGQFSKHQCRSGAATTARKHSEELLVKAVASGRVVGQQSIFDLMKHQQKKLKPTATAAEGGSANTGVGADTVIDLVTSGAAASGAAEGESRATASTVAAGQKGSMQFQYASTSEDSGEDSDE
jgi:hypothetical protein